ncbi:M4 family metallopeptidase [Pseudozobellia thermophila]|uniref:Neutral metalloproteinase n=1 Tax=Pseudozobellia thermophila TaxID=192903 RepID=A0A1M6EPN0_9FLAO|nr:M4 family metallopeptidase [Pseudozobellia thermophila]SHI87431.1 Thermolysin metallopeptidase, catalytic domain [Pseudozobellia thermophila]
MCTAKCHIVPPHILEELAKRGSLSCKRTLNDTGRIRERRQNALNYLLSRAQEAGEGKRFVYDCKTQYEQRVALVRQEGEDPVADEAANKAYDTSGFVRDYFRNTFGLNSIDDNGLDIISNIHYGVAYNNAYWDGDEMTYGDGDGREFTNFAGAIDVVAHELAHGVTQFLANLEYQSQPGALNEHFSDVFGTVVKQKYLGQDVSEADWLIGDSVVTEAFPGVAIRSMKAPGTANDFDTQPDHMDNYYNGTADNQGVHINSGIPNKAFYLSCMEIGIDDCALIWFETLRALWRTANFNDMLETLVNTAQSLADESRVAENAVEAVTASFAQVGLTRTVV